MKIELTSQVRRLVSKKDWWKYFAAASASSSVRNPTKPNCRVLPSLQFPITLTVLNPPHNRVNFWQKKIVPLLSSSIMCMIGWMLLPQTLKKITLWHKLALVRIVAFSPIQPLNLSLSLFLHWAAKFSFLLIETWTSTPCCRYFKVSLQFQSTANRKP